MISFDKDTDIALQEATAKEWLVTNGIGGYASSSIPCINTRRYHGILIASRRPPIERVVLVSRLEETISLRGQTYPLSACIQKNEQKSITGFQNLERFERTPLPTWYYQIQDILVIKTLSMVYGKNTTVVTYKILANGNDVSLKITPHYLFRDFHGNMFEHEGISNCVKSHNKQLILKPFANAPELYMRWDCGTFQEEFHWHKNVVLAKEEERGLPSLEDDFTCGSIEVNPFTGSFSIAFSDEPIASFNPMDLRRREEQRLENVANSLESSDDTLKMLLLAADQFIVNRKSTGGKTILAGYPWFSDWGRDTLIALPGLTLVPGRYDDAKSILKTFASSLKHGLVPNCFADVGNEASYNSVDASLWFFIAVHKFLEYTEDYDFVKSELLDSMTKIIDAFMDGTIYDIQMDSSDCLISAGNDDIQLTWMDVKVDGEVITPRNGKAVEINALWYNALMIYVTIQEKFGNNVNDIKSIACRAKMSFTDTFWNEKGGYLYDYIKPDGTPDFSFRPNQIFATYLPFDLLERTKEKQVVDAVFARLYTSYGLRSLDPNDEKYVAYYRGNRVNRDKAYHQGTVWSYLIGPFISSFLKVNNNSVEAQLRASLMIDPFVKHMKNAACIGSISEIFDGNMPYKPKGCFAQAWSVAEVLRCYVEDIKGQKPSLML